MRSKKTKLQLSKLQELPKKYPELFKNTRYDDIDGEPFFYFQCRDGWYTLLDNLLGNLRYKFKRWKDVEAIKAKSGDQPMPWITEFFKRTPIDPMMFFTILQIKEKFGGLRFYWGGDISDECRNYIRGVVDTTESLSYSVCEACGAPGKTTTAEWRVTLCEEHTEAKRVRVEEWSKKHSREELKDATVGQQQDVGFSKSGVHTTEKDSSGGD